jgi:ribosomal protein S27E
MEPIAAKSSLAIDIRRQINACCQEFEKAWKEGKTPSIEEFLSRVTQASQAQLLKELLLLELNYRRDERGMRLTDSQVCALHPRLMPDIAEQLQLLRQSPLGKSPATIDVPPPVPASSYDTLVPAPADNFATVERPISESHAALAYVHEPRLSGSRGLNIRCPHCNSAIEVLSDTPYDSIKCGLCGSDFNLVERDEHT